MQIEFRCALNVFVLMASLTLFGCDLHRTAQTADKKIEVKMPVGWIQTTLPTSRAKLIGKNVVSEGYAALYADAKMDFSHYDLKKYAASSMNNSARGSKLTNRVADPPQDVTVNGKPAIRYHVTGTLSNGTNVAYYHTFFETSHSYIQVMCWSTPSVFDANAADFEAFAAGVVDHQP